MERWTPKRQRDYFLKVMPSGEPSMILDELQETDDPEHAAYLVVEQLYINMVCDPQIQLDAELRD